MTEEKIETYWQKFLSVLPPDSPYRTKTYTAESWGDSPEMADQLGDLIVRDIKTATCSALWEWQAEGKPISSGRTNHYRAGWARGATMYH